MSLDGSAVCHRRAARASSTGHVGSGRTPHPPVLDGLVRDHRDHRGRVQLWRIGDDGSDDTRGRIRSAGRFAHCEPGAS
jgi:hypothetical protein